MNSFIFIGIILIFLFIVFKIGMQPHIFKDINLREVYRFLYLLLYRGFYEGPLTKNGNMFITYRFREREIAFVKYKEKGKIGIYMLIPLYKDIQNIKSKIIEKINCNKLHFYFEKSPEENIDEMIFIDLNRDLELTQEFLEYIVIELFEIKKEERIFDVHLWNINPDFTEIMGFEKNEIPDFKKLKVDISIPVQKGTWTVRQIRIFMSKIFR